MPLDNKTYVAEIAERYGKGLYRFFHKRLGSRRSHVAQDLIQEVYLKLLRAPDPSAIKNSQAYLFTVARHVLSQHAHANDRLSDQLPIEEVISELFLGEQQGPEEIADLQARIARLNLVIRDLPAAQRAAFFMRNVQGMTVREIAAELHVAKKAVKIMLKQAMTHCRSVSNSSQGKL